MRSAEKPNCLVCSSEGKALYSKQDDKLFCAPGSWTIYECSDKKCGLLWLNPMPVVEDIAEAYRKYCTHYTKSEPSTKWLARVKKYIRNCYLTIRFGYKKQANSFFWLNYFIGLIVYIFPAKRSEVDFSVMHLPFKKNGRLLDIGCGSGELLSIMKDLGWQVEGLEVDPIGAGIARAKGLKVHLGDIFSKNYINSSFDAITLSHVIEHVHDPIGLIRECARISKPGGKISIATPNSESLGHLIFKSNWLHLDPPRHLHIFNNNVLEKIAQELGLIINLSKTTIRFADTLLIASRSITNTGSYAWGSDLRAGIKQKISAKLYQLFEWLLLKVSPSVGEEVLLVLTKGDNSE